MSPQPASESSLVTDVAPLHPRMFPPMDTSLSGLQKMFHLLSPQDAALVQNVQVFCFRKRPAKPNETTFGQFSCQAHGYLPYLATPTHDDIASIVGLRCKCCAFLSQQGVICRPLDGATRFPTSSESMASALQSIHFHLAVQCPHVSKTLRDTLNYKGGNTRDHTGQLSLKWFVSWYCDTHRFFNSRTNKTPAPIASPPSGPPTLSDESFEELQDAISKGLASHFYARLVPDKALVVVSDLNDLPWSQDHAESPFVAHLLECLEMVQTCIPAARSNNARMTQGAKLRPETVCQKQEEVKGYEQTFKKSAPQKRQKSERSNERERHKGKNVSDTAFVIRCRYCHGTCSPENANEYDQAFLHINRFFNNKTKLAEAVAWAHAMGYNHIDDCPHIPPAVKHRILNLRPGTSTCNFTKNARHLCSRFKQWVEWIQEVLLQETIDVVYSATEDVDIWMPLSAQKIREFGKDFVEPVPAVSAPTIVLPVFLGHFGVRYNDVVVNVSKAREHSGNKRFRLLVSQLRPDYLAASFTMRKLVARSLVRTVLDRGGRIGTLPDNDGDFQGYSFDESVNYATKALSEGVSSLLRPITTNRGPGSLVLGCEVAPHYGVLHGKLWWPSSSGVDSSKNPLRRNHERQVKISVFKGQQSKPC